MKTLKANIMEVFYSNHYCDNVTRFQVEIWLTFPMSALSSPFHLCIWFRPAHPSANTNLYKAVAGKSRHHVMMRTYVFQWIPCGWRRWQCLQRDSTSASWVQPLRRPQSHCVCHNVSSACGQDDVESTRTSTRTKRACENYYVTSGTINVSRCNTTALFSTVKRLH